MKAGRLRVVLDGRIVIPRMTGAGRYVIELARRLPDLAEDLQIEVLLRPEVKLTRVPGLLLGSGATVHYVDARVASLGQWLVIPAVLARLKPDLYHYPFFDLPYVAAPSVVTLYDLNPMTESGYFDRYALIKRTAARMLIRSTLRRSRAALAISEATRTLIQKHWPESANKVRTVHLGVDSDAWAKATRDGNVPIPDQAALGAWRSRRYVLYVGVDRPHKNLIRLVRSFERFRQRNGWQNTRGPYLWLAGVGDGSPQLRAQVEASGLREDVRLDHELDEDRLRVAYAGAIAVAYVSTSEGFGLPVLEAFAAGVPVICSDRSSLPEVGGDAVAYVDPYDELSISDVLHKVQSDERLRRELAVRGQQRVAQFSWNATAIATRDVYYEVLGLGDASQP